jgi:hypothetical protein
MKPARRAEVLGGPGWWLRRVTRLESSFVDPAATEDLIRTYGVDHPVVRAKVYAEFPETSTVGTAIPPAVVDRMFLRHEAPDAPGEELQVGVDVAREGGDETACYVRRGCRILGAIHKTHTPGPEVVQMAVQLAFRWWRRPWNDPRTDAWYPETPEDWEKLRDTILFVVDETGVGGPILDSIRALGLRGVGVNNGGSARRKDRFANIGAEMWLDDALRWMDTGYCAEDERLRAQLTQRKVQYSGVGEQRRLESKEKMRPRRGSPDRADGFVLSVARVRAPGLADFSRAAIGL